VNEFSRMKIAMGLSAGSESAEANSKRRPSDLHSQPNGRSFAYVQFQLLPRDVFQRLIVILVLTFHISFRFGASLRMPRLSFTRMKSCSSQMREVN